MCDGPEQEFEVLIGAGMTNAQDAGARRERDARLRQALFGGGAIDRLEGPSQHVRDNGDAGRGKAEQVDGLPGRELGNGYHVVGAGERPEAVAKKCLLQDPLPGRTVVAGEGEGKDIVAGHDDGRA